MNKIPQYIKLIEEKTGSKTFCVLPWIHLATRPNGDARLCCGSNASQATKGILDAGLVKKENGEVANFGKDTLQQAFNNEYMRDVRKTMLEGKIPSSCSKCFEEEHNGILSKRIWEMYEWDKDGIDFKELIDNTDESGKVPPEIRYFDIRLGHTCNLKCVMCTPHDSSKWVQDHKKIIPILNSQVVLSQISWDQKDFDNTWYEKSEFWDEVFEQIPHIQQMYFAGGEPLMIKEHHRFLEEIIKRGYEKQITLRYNTNGIFVDDHIIDLWSKFKKVKVAFSIDATDIRNHYIRYPSEWDVIVKNLHRLDNTPDNIHIGIACAVQVFNIKHIVDFAKWKIQQNFKKINQYPVENYLVGGGIINMHMLYIPTFLSARILPKEDKDEIRQQILEFKDWLYENYTKDPVFWEENPYGWQRWQSILNFIDAEDHTHLLPDFKEYVNKLDSIRNIDSKTIFPELKHLL
jgi:MoaA/NifB/PqqE/SkfB family radical SAM enzyme